MRTDLISNKYLFYSEQTNYVFRLVKLLKETYGHDNVAARADQISIRLEENSALINTNTKVKFLDTVS